MTGGEVGGLAPRDEGPDDDSLCGYCGHPYGYHCDERQACEAGRREACDCKKWEPWEPSSYDEMVRS